MPNDEEEQDRMELMHHICRLLVGGGLFRAPVMDQVQPDERIRILDLGTGTGSW